MSVVEKCIQSALRVLLLLLFAVLALVIIYPEVYEWREEHTALKFSLGSAYDNGKVIEKDANRSIHLYREAAKCGFDEAQFALGDAYSKSKVGYKDLSDAVKWYRMAAAQGHVKAQYRLAVSYDMGKGVIKSQHEAYIWYLIAQAGGEDAAGERLQTWNLTTYLTKDKIRSAQILASQRLARIGDKDWLNVWLCRAGSDI